MSEQHTPRGRHDQQAIDFLLADAGLTGDADLRTELLELRSLANTAPPMPSAAVRALMVSSPAAATQQITATQQISATQRITTADGPVASAGAPTAVLATVAAESAPANDLPVDELAARRRKKRRTAIAGLAVAVSLAGGATAAVASEGGLPGAFQHLGGAAIGSVVSQLNPGSGSAPQPDAPAGTSPEPLPVGGEEPQQAPATVVPQPTPAAPGIPVVPAPEPQPGGASPHTPKVPSHREPGNGVIPTPPGLPVTPPEIDPSKIDPSKLGPSASPSRFPRS